MATYFLDPNATVSNALHLDGAATLDAVLAQLVRQPTVPPNSGTIDARAIAFGFTNSGTVDLSTVTLGAGESVSSIKLWVNGLANGLSFFSFAIVSGGVEQAASPAFQGVAQGWKSVTWSPPGSFGQAELDALRVRVTCAAGASPNFSFVFAGYVEITTTIVPSVVPLPWRRSVAAYHSPRALVAPASPAAIVFYGLKNTGLTDTSRSAPGYRPHVAPVLRSPRALVHPKTRAPIRFDGAILHTGNAGPVQFDAGLYRVRVAPVWRSPQALLHPRARPAIVFRPVTSPFVVQDFAGRHRTIVVPRVRGPEPGAPLFVRGRLAEFGRRYAAARGLYRVFGPAVFRFFRSTSGPPLETDVPFATSSSLSTTPAVPFSDGTWYVSVSYFDGVLDSGFLPIGPNGQTYLTVVISSGGLGGVAPLAPLAASLELRAGGVVRVRAIYAESGANRADTWAISYTTNGSDPVVGAPNATSAFKNAITPQVLVYDLPAQPDGTTVKVLVQTRRGSVYSSPSEILTAVADATGPAQIPGGDAWRGSLPEEVL